MSETPRTDAIAPYHRPNSYNQLRAHAERLELELNAAKAQLLPETPDQLRALLKAQTTELVNAQAAVRELTARLIERTKAYEAKDAAQVMEIARLKSEAQP